MKKTGTVARGAQVRKEPPSYKRQLIIGGYIEGFDSILQKKMVPAVLKCEVVERKVEKSGGKKKRMLMDESTWYTDFTKSNVFTISPFKVRDEVARVEVFKVAFFMLSSTLDSE